MDIPVFKFLTEKLQGDFLPRKAHPEDTGWDVCSRLEEIILRPGQYAKIPLGFRVFAPPGWWLELRPRSSTFVKKQLHALYGVIDEGYENEAIFACQYIPDVSAMGQDLVISTGDAIGQIIPVKRQEMIVEEVSQEEYMQLVKQRKSSRGDGGFGSSDRK